MRNLLIRSVAAAAVLLSAGQYCEAANFGAVAANAFQANVGRCQAYNGNRHPAHRAPGVAAGGIAQAAQDVIDETDRIIRHRTYHAGNANAAGVHVPNRNYQEAFVYDTFGGGIGQVRHGGPNNTGNVVPVANIHGGPNSTPANAAYATEYSVVNGYSVDTAIQLLRRGNGKVALLNYASDYRTGGGFLVGANQQEEKLCGCSTLFASLASDRAWNRYYKFNSPAFRVPPGIIATSHRNISERIIISPNVLFFHSENPVGNINAGNINPAWLPNAHLMSVITAAAVDRRIPAGAPHHNPNPNATMQALIRNMLMAAIYNGYTTLVLGAWGCGVFGGNNPAATTTAVANAFRAALTGPGGLAPFFKKIVFVVPNAAQQGAFTAAFPNRVAHAQYGNPAGGNINGAI